MCSLLSLLILQEFCSNTSLCHQDNSSSSALHLSTVKDHCLKTCLPFTSWTLFALRRVWDGCFEKSLRWWWKLEIKVEITWQNLIVIFAGYGHQKLCGLLGGITDFPKLRLCHLVTRSYGRDHLYDTTIHRLHHFSYTTLRDIIQYSINIYGEKGL